MKTTEFYIYELEGTPLFLINEICESLSQTKEYFSGLTFKITPKGVETFHGEVSLPKDGLKKVAKEEFIESASGYLDNMEQYGSYIRSKIDYIHRHANDDGKGKRVTSSKKAKRESGYQRRVQSRNAI